MDLYLEILAELAIEPLTFDENNVCSFEIEQVNKSDSLAFVVNIVRNIEAMALNITASTATEIPSSISPELFSLLGKHALGPLRGDTGVGVFPDTNRVSVFTCLSLSNYHTGQLKEALSDLIEKVQLWELALTTKNQQSQDTDLLDNNELGNLRV